MTRRPTGALPMVDLAGLAPTKWLDNLHGLVLQLQVCPQEMSG